MRKSIVCLVLIVVTAIASHSQTSSIKGTVTDTVEKKNLSNAVVSLLRKSDSLLIKFTRTNSNGEFILSHAPDTSCVLMITYPKYADFADEIIPKADDTLDLRKISLIQKAVLLQEVIVHSVGAIRIKGDTTEFIADSFKIREGATVEDLLKRLPGLSVNSRGEITAQGKRVDKVLVDGEEFFGDDPTMATQNISARAVDKIQVYDTKSDQQQLTGISTGDEGKTVNIKLKEDSKKGAFGKAHFATDAQDLIDAKVFYNRFKGKEKISVYGTKSDISTGSLNWEDRQKLGIENDIEYDEISGWYYSFGSNDEFNDWSLRGLPHAYTAGALYSNKWKAEKNNFNTSYRYNRLNTENESSTLTQNILTNSITYRNKFQNTSGLNQQHVLTGKYEWKPDSLTSFKFSSALTYKTNHVTSTMHSDFLNEVRQPVNTSDQYRDNNTEHTQNDNQFTYKQLFNKKNRQLIATLRYGIIDDDQKGIILTNTGFYKDNIVDSADVADQQKIFKGDSKTFGSKVTFSEPLTSKWNLIVDYSYNNNASVSHRNTFNKSTNGKYDIPDSVYSNNFDLDAFAHSSIAIFKYADKKLQFAFGSGVSTIKLKLFNIDSNLNTEYNFFKLTPQANIRYTFKPQTGIAFNYRGTTRQPTIDQLQPIRDNSDRLNIFIGNPNLKVAFNHSFSIFFNTYKVLSQKGVFGNFSYNIPVNSVSFHNTLNVATGEQTYMPVNVKGNRNWNMWLDYFKDGGEKKLGYSANFESSGGRNVNFINAERNITKYLNSNLNLSLRYNVPDKKTLEFGPRIGYNTSRSSQQKDFNTDYWNYGGHIYGMIALPHKFELTTECDLDFRQQIAAFRGSPDITTWNATLSKKVLKDKGKIFFIANDLLNQNKGFNRTINTNFITEERYSKISRYFLLKFEWSFSKVPGSSTPTK